ncbi:MAG: hypothetical protein ACRDG6_08955 [Candidatus Limnocylindria bacterium]
MKAPDHYVRWVNGQVGFNPRGQGHSDELTARVFADLAAVCRLFASRVRDGSLDLRKNVGLNGIRSTRAGAVEAEDADPQEIDSNIDGVALGVSGLWSTSATAGSPLALENDNHDCPRESARW